MCWLEDQNISETQMQRCFLPHQKHEFKHSNILKTQALEKVKSSSVFLHYTMPHFEHLNISKTKIRRCALQHEMLHFDIPKVAEI